MTTPYFTPATFTFLETLAANNRRDWFNDHKQDYEDHVRSPALRFIEIMSDQLPMLSPEFCAVAKRQGGSLMRIYRDARFSHDKTPYKTNIGLRFLHTQGKDVHAPMYYLHVHPHECFLAAGIWRPESAVLKKIRACLDENPRAWTKAVTNKKFTDNFALSGDTLIRPPRGYKDDHELITDLKRKDFIAIQTIDRDMVTSKKLPEFCINAFKNLDGFMRYLCFAVELPFD